MADLPVACTLSPAALKARRQNLLNTLVRRAQERRELPNGYRLRFAPEGEILLDIVRTVDAERHCCRFLQFTIVVEPDEALITLDLTGPAGTREFLADLFDFAELTERDHVERQSVPPRPGPATGSPPEPF